MPETEPTLEEWRELYEAMKDFKRIAPWEWMLDNDVFGVEDPESHEVGYCCILGYAGLQRALIVYRGSTGLAGYWKMLRRDIFQSPADMLTSQYCLEASFEERDLITPEDYAVMKQLGIKVRGRGNWPQFRSYRPGYRPWYLTGEEARFLTLAMRNACIVARRQANSDFSLLPRVTPRSQYLVKVPYETPTGLSWRDEMRKPAPIKRPRIKPAPIDKERLSALANSLRRVDIPLTLHTGYSPTPISGEGGERPWFPIMMIAMDLVEEYLFDIKIAESAKVAEEMPQALIGVFERYSFLPAAIRINDRDMLTYLAPTLRALDIAYDYAPDLPTAAALYMALDAEMERRAQVQNDTVQ